MALGFPASDTPLLATNTAIRTPFGLLLPPGARVAAYVGTQVDANDFYADGRLRVDTLNEGLNRCRSGAGDVVVVMEGHTESITSADQMSNLVAGTKIVGAGDNLFTYDTAATASFLLDVDDVTLDGLKFDCTGIDNVAAPMTVTGARAQLLGCEFLMSSGTEGVVQGIALSGTAADGFRMINCALRSIGEADPTTTGMVVIGGASDDIVLQGNYISAATPGDTVGVIDVTAAATNLRIIDNDLIQLESTDAAFALIVDNVAATGVVKFNRVRLSENNAPATSGLSIGASAVISLHDNTVTAAHASGALSPAADT